MTTAGTWEYDDDTRFWRDVVIAFQHPDYQDVQPIDALADIRQRRNQPTDHPDTQR